MDPHYPPMDYGGVALSHVRYLAGRALGLCGSWLGRILGLGPCGKRFPASMAFHYGIPALSHDAGKARHDESVECLANLYHLHALNPGNAADTKRHRQLCALICAIQYRQLVYWISSNYFCGLPG